MGIVFKIGRCDDFGGLFLLVHLIYMFFEVVEDA